MAVRDGDGHFGVGQLYGSIGPFVVDLKFVDLTGQETLRGARGDVSCRGDMQKQRSEGKDTQQIVHSWAVAGDGGDWTRTCTALHCMRYEVYLVYLEEPYLFMY